MPLRIFQVRKRDSPMCHKCQKCSGKLLHMLWEYDKIHLFWSNVTHFVATKFDLPNMCSPKLCILGVLEEVDLSSYQKLFLRFLLFYARKTVVLQLIYPTVVSLYQWIPSLPRYYQFISLPMKLGVALINLSKYGVPGRNLSTLACCLRYNMYSCFNEEENNYPSLLKEYWFIFSVCFQCGVPIAFRYLLRRHSVVGSTLA